MNQLPRYRELHQFLRKQILMGNYKNGDLLPSENELSSRHNLNRMTVRQALGELVKDGLIYKHKGKGSIVKYKLESLELLSFRGFSEVISETEHRANTTFLHQPYPSQWGDDFFFPLSKIEAKAGCFRVDRLRYVDEIPVMIEYTFVPDLDIPGFDELAFINDSLFDTLQLNYHIDVISVQQELRAIPAKGEIALLLKVQPNSPILHIYRRYGTSREGFYLYSALYCNTEKYAIGSIFN